ncbi:ABC transporter ATP-binding protein [Solirhodobacter olei]|uniref:ABC transporter ATP-binding protein n=1 Tax=Solirhodobacter olei TaxID=2493082 RepID=UPI000FD842B8|nr:ATP-binding cassette domain-containing protein [Solirhodobacter olei]
MLDSLVEAENIAKTYDGGEAPEVLRDISCRVLPGDRIAVAGPSGSGKSTLLHILAGLTAPSRGTVTWPLLGIRDVLMPARVQVVFQSPSLFPPLDVADNIALPLLLAGRGEGARAKAMDLLARFGIEELATKLPEELSGGQAQRVSMARALSIAPEMVLADEPTGQLDSATAQRFLDTVFEIAAEAGTALVLATHDPAVAGRMSRVWMIDHGSLFVRSQSDGETA